MPGDFRGRGRGGEGDETKRASPGHQRVGGGGGEINEMSLNGLINIIARFINSPGV